MSVHHHPAKEICFDLIRGTNRAVLGTQTPTCAVRAVLRQRALAAASCRRVLTSIHYNSARASRIHRLR
jgi:hypothetical protein